VDFPNNDIWDVETHNRLRAISDIYILDWVIESVYSYLIQVEPVHLQSFSSFIFVAKWLNEPDNLYAQAKILHSLRPFVDHSYLSIVTGLLLSKQAFCLNKTSYYNTHWVLSLRGLTSRPQFNELGIGIVMNAYAKVKCKS
jgi:hypothetical protein